MFQCFALAAVMLWNWRQVAGDCNETGVPLDTYTKGEREARELRKNTGGDVQMEWVVESMQLGRKSSTW